MRPNIKDDDDDDDDDTTLLYYENFLGKFNQRRVYNCPISTKFQCKYSIQNFVAICFGN
jgi:hypothetical protein